MAGHPLRSATDRRFGRPLPHQLANQTRVHLIPPEFFTPGHATLCAYAVLAVVSNCYPPVWGRLPTRYSPVRHSVTKSSFRRNQIKCFVRLACVKHAASVHPEPGSNSHVKKFSCPVINWLNQISIWFTVLRLFLYRNVRVLLFTTPWNSLNLSRLFHCSVIKVLCFVVVLGDSLFIISYQICLVKNFFHFLNFFLSIGFIRSVISNATTLIFYHVLFCLSTTFSKKIRTTHIVNNKRRRRDLNPRAAVNDLHPFQGCPFGQLGYFSELHYILIRTDFHQ